jgi:beta-glucosidase
MDWYSGTPPYTVTPLDGIRQAAGDRIKVWFAADDAAGAAAALARQADLAIVVVGNHPWCDAGWQQCPVASDGKEAVDRKSIELEQEALVRAVYAANHHTVLVLKKATRWPTCSSATTTPRAGSCTRGRSRRCSCRR